MTISSWLNFGRPTPPGRGAVVGWNFLALPYYSQHAVFASLWALFYFCCLIDRRGDVHAFAEPTLRKTTSETVSIIYIYILSLFNSYCICNSMVTRYYYYFSPTCINCIFYILYFYFFCILCSEQFSFCYFAYRLVSFLVTVK